MSQFLHRNTKGLNNDAKELNKQNPAVEQERQRAEQLGAALLALGIDPDQVQQG